MTNREQIFLGLMMLVGVAILSFAVVWGPAPGRASSGCTEFNNPDRHLPNSYRLRVMSFCAYRIKWGPDHVVLPTTAEYDGVLEVAVIGNVVVGPVLDFSSSPHALVGWFWLDTDTREFRENLSVDEIDRLLAAKSQKRPDVLTPAQSLPGYAWGD